MKGLFFTLTLLTSCFGFFTAQASLLETTPSWRALLGIESTRTALVAGCTTALAFYWYTQRNTALRQRNDARRRIKDLKAAIAELKSVDRQRVKDAYRQGLAAQSATSDSSIGILEDYDGSPQAVEQLFQEIEFLLQQQGATNA